VAGSLRVAWFLQAGLLLLSLPVAAQVRLGDLTTSLSGNFAPGYTADYGNLTSSDHTWTLGGTANLSGSYHNPNFLSYDVNMFLNQSRANSDYQSISDASGINVTSTIFGGSHFPGSVSYSKDFDSEGNYALPGIANYVTHGNNDSLGINWSANLPNVPSVSAGFLMGHSRYSVYGTDDEGTTSFHSINLHSAYSLAGFNMGAFYNKGASHALIPQVVTGQSSTTTDSDNDAFGFNVAHRLPLQGSASASITRSTWNTDYLGYSTNGTIDLFNALVSVHPLQKLALSVNANYSDNLSGQLVESLATSGGIVPGLNSNDTSNSLDLMAIASYIPLPTLQASAFVERRTQHFEGVDYGVDSYGGSVSYAHKLYNGNLNASLTVTANSADDTGVETMGMTAIANYSNEIGGWQVNGSFSYAQNVQTLLVTYTNSFYNYSGSARRRWGKFNISAGGGGGRTALSEQAGTANSSESVNGSVGYNGWINANGSYSKSSGQALATGAGLVPVTVPTPVPTDLVSLFGGDSYSFGLSSSPVRHLVLSASYARADTNTHSAGVASVNVSDEFNSQIRYDYRKLNFNSGYARVAQGFSVSGTQTEVISSFYIGVSRWFNFF
jgi:hypothetical protein